MNPSQLISSGLAPGHPTILCFGISHQTAPVEVRERYALAQTPELLQEIASLDGSLEALLLSTCNRVEIYSAGPPAASVLRDFLASKCGGGPEEESHFYELHDERAISHLFRVACGMESMVLGETEILGQVKSAYAAACAAGTVAKTLNTLFQRAFQVAKQVRTRTAITRGSVSIGSVAVDLAGRIFGDLRRCHIMIMGAGDTSEKTARALLSKGAKGLFVSNRSHERAAALAAELGGVAVHFDQWQTRLAETDIIISSTSAPHHVVRRSQIEETMSSRLDRPLFLIDLAVPRDIDPGVDELDGVYRYDIDSLQGIANEAMALRRQDLNLCEEIIAKHVGEVRRKLSHHHAPAAGARLTKSSRSPGAPGASRNPETGGSRALPAERATTA